MASLPKFIAESKELLRAKGSLLFLKPIPNIKYGEVVEVELEGGEHRLGQVIDVSRDAVIVQVFGGSSEINLKTSKVRFRGETLKLPVSTDMLGRVFDGLGRPIDGGPPIVPEDYYDIHGSPMNPAARLPPSEFIETGISVIDGMNSIVRGQKLPIFSGAGLPHNRIAAQIVRQASVRGEKEKFAVVFAAIGVTFEEASFFIENFRKTGALENSVAFINTASASVMERLATPRVALTAAEFLAWSNDMHVLVVITDMTNYAEALRELSAAREEVPGRRGYPGYMYSVDGSRKVVVLDDKGLLKVITLRKLFEELSKQNTVIKDPLGFEERIKVRNLYALSASRNGKVSFKPIKYIIRHKYRGKMVKITTELGETIVTPNHSVFTLENNVLKVIEAGKLRKGDLVVHVQKLPSFKEHRIKLADLDKLMNLYLVENYITDTVTNIGDFFNPSKNVGSEITYTYAGRLFKDFHRDNTVLQNIKYMIKHYGTIVVGNKFKDSMIWLIKQMFPNHYVIAYESPIKSYWNINVLTELKAKHVVLNDVIAVEVKEVKYVDPSDEWVYDLSVEDNENFVEAFGGILLHNTDLATIYERAGRLRGKKGSITQMPILTMPDDDITHPVPDLTGYITEGQIVLSRELHRKGIYPPVDVLLSLSRLMKDGIGPDKTREDHRDIYMQLYAAYAEGQYLRELTMIVGTEGLSERDKKYLVFADRFEKEFINQGEYERRTIEETLDKGWELLSILPEGELSKIREEYIKKYHPKYRKGVK